MRPSVCLHFVCMFVYLFVCLEYFKLYIRVLLFLLSVFSVMSHIMELTVLIENYAYIIPGDILCGKWRN